MTVITGGNGPDVLIGTSGWDWIWAGKGDDILSGLGGTDFLFGGKGADLLKGGKGYDFLSGGKGADVVVSVDADFMSGGKGEDTAVLLRTGTTKALKIDLSCSFQILADGTVLSDFERLVFAGGAGDDVVKGGKLGDLLEGGLGADTLNGAGGDDRLIGGALDKLYGGDGCDIISLTSLPARVEGGNGADTVRVLGPVAFMPNVVVGVEAFEVVQGYLNFARASGAGERVSFNNFFDPPGGPTTSGPGLVITTSSQVLKGEPDPVNALGVNILGSSRDDSITGGDRDDHLNGGRGDDILMGGGGSDRLDGGTGNDQLLGGTGDDRLFSVNPDGHICDQSLGAAPQQSALLTAELAVPYCSHV
jgi:Ca2+-binding RTX toxin-like protein